MAARIRYAATPGGTYVATVERLSDGLAWDGTTFVPLGPTTKQVPLKESASPWAGRYSATIDATSGWTGNYVVNVHQFFAPSNLGPVVGVLQLVMFAGDDAPAPPAQIQIITNVPIPVVTPKAI